MTRVSVADTGASCDYARGKMNNVILDATRRTACVCIGVDSHTSSLSRCLYIRSDAWPVLLDDFVDFAREKIDVRHTSLYVTVSARARYSLVSISIPRALLCPLRFNCVSFGS